jgi:preprotein translocase subunit SecG
MENIIIAVHVLAALSIIGLILLQQGKGAEMGASFGSGSSQALFGPQGTGTIFSHATAILTAVFFATSLGLAVYAKHKITGTLEEGIPAAEVIQSVNQPATDVPATDNKPAAPESEVPQQ